MTCIPHSSGKEISEFEPLAADPGDIGYQHCLTGKCVALLHIVHSSRMKTMKFHLMKKNVGLQVRISIESWRTAIK